MKQLTLLLASTLTVMAGAALAPALPKIAAFYSDASDIWIKLVLTIPALFTALGSPIAGWAIDRYGRRRVLLAATLLYGIAGAGGGLLSSLPWLLVSRAFLGVAVGTVLTTVTALIGDYYEGDQRSEMMGRQGAFTGLGGVTFLGMSGILADIGWRVPFSIYLFSLLLLPLMLLFITEPGRLTTSTTSADDLAALPRRLLGSLYLVAFLGMVVFYLVPVQLPFHLLDLGIPSSSRAGLAMAGFTLVSAFGSLAYGRLRRRFDFAALFAFAFVFMAAGYGLLAAAETYQAVLVALAVAGVGMGLCIPNVNLWATAAAPASLRGRVLGGLTTAIFLGQFVSPIAGFPIIERWGTSGAYAAASGLLVLMAAAYGIAALQSRATRA